MGQVIGHLHSLLAFCISEHFPGLVPAGNLCGVPLFHTATGGTVTTEVLKGMVLDEMHAFCEHFLACCLGAC